MRHLLAALAIALSAPAAAAAATPPRMVPFDVSRAESWADALALCDLTAFLRTRPSLDADVVLAADPRSELPLYGPRFLPPGLFFDDRTRLTFERLEKAGEVNRQAVGEARARHDRPLFRAYQRAGSQDIAFLEEQSRLCAALTLDVRQRYP